MTQNLGDVFLDRAVLLELLNRQRDRVERLEAQLRDLRARAECVGFGDGRKDT